MLMNDDGPRVFGLVLPILSFDTNEDGRLVPQICWTSWWTVSNANDSVTRLRIDMRSAGPVGSVFLIVTADLVHIAHHLSNGAVETPTIRS